MIEKDVHEYLSGVIETIINCTKTTVLAALVMMACLAAPCCAVESEMRTNGEIARTEKATVALEEIISDRETIIVQAIDALEKEKELYESRARSAERQATRIMSLDWLAYRQSQREFLRYRARVDQTQTKIDELKNELECIRANQGNQ